jgi:hypothetical protein
MHGAQLAGGGRESTAARAYSIFVLDWCVAQQGTTHGKLVARQAHDKILRASHSRKTHIKVSTAGSLKAPSSAFTGLLEAWHGVPYKLFCHYAYAIWLPDIGNMLLVGFASFEQSCWSSGRVLDTLQLYLCSYPERCCVHQDVDLQRFTVVLISFPSRADNVFIWGGSNDSRR